MSVTPQQKIQNFKFFQNALRILNVSFSGDNAYFWGDNVTFGDIRYTLGDSRRFYGFGDLFFVVGGGGFGPLWVGGSCRGFQKR